MKAGQIVKFHTPNQDEDPNQLYIVLEVNEDRVDIQALDTNLTFPPINRVDRDDLINA